MNPHKAHKQDRIVAEFSAGSRGTNECKDDHNRRISADKANPELARQAGRYDKPAARPAVAQ